MELKALQEAAAQAASTLEEANAQLATAQAAETPDKEAIKLLKSAVTAAKRELTKADNAVTKAQKAAEREAAKAAKVKEREEAKAKKAAEKEAAAAAKAAAKEANKMPTQNGITRPKPNTKCGEVWGKADELSAKRKSPTPLQPLIDALPNQNVNNVKTEYSRWRKFHGVSGRIVDAKEAPAKAEASE